MPYRMLQKALRTRPERGKARSERGEARCPERGEARCPERGEARSERGEARRERGEARRGFSAAAGRILRETNKENRKTPDMSECPQGTSGARRKARALRAKGV